MKPELKGTEVVEGVAVGIKDGVLLIAVDMTQNKGRSKGGKMDVVAKTGGFLRIPGTNGIFQLSVYNK